MQIAPARRNGTLRKTLNCAWLLESLSVPNRQKIARINRNGGETTATARGDLLAAYKLSIFIARRASAHSSDNSSREVGYAPPGAHRADFNRLIESCRKGFQLCFSRAAALIGFNASPAITLAVQFY